MDFTDYMAYTLIIFQLFLMGCGLGVGTQWILSAIGARTNFWTARWRDPTRPGELFSEVCSVAFLILSIVLYWASDSFESYADYVRMTNPILALFFFVAGWALEHFHTFEKWFNGFGNLGYVWIMMIIVIYILVLGTN